MRKKSLLLALIFMLSFSSVFSAVEVLKGIYQGKNLFVQNTMIKNRSAFSTKAVFVNDKKTISYPNTTSFQIDLSYLPLNTPLVIKIVYADGCRAPRVLNAQVIKPASVITFLSFDIDESSIVWVTRGESNIGDFYVQQFMNHHWSDVFEVKGKHSLSSNNYTLDSRHHHGVNQYRIKYIDSEGKVTFSSVKRFTSNRPPITFYPQRVVTNTITFSSKRAVYYEVFNDKGNLIMADRSKVIDCSSLEKGKVYSISFDNQHTTFIKK